MKKLLLLSSLFLSIIYSCTKENKTPEERFIQEARDYFETQVLNGPKNTTEAVSMRFRDDRKVNWDHANIQKLRGKFVVVVPLTMPGLKVKMRNYTEEWQVDQNAFLVYGNDEKGEHAEMYLKIPDEYSCETSFSGAVFVTDWTGKPLQTFHYKNGLERVVGVPTITPAERGPQTETEFDFDNCYLFYWYYSVQYGSYPVEYYFNYSVMYCWEGSGVPSGGNPPGWTAPPPGGTPGTISGGTNTYPLAKKTQLIKFDSSIKTNLLSPCVKEIMTKMQDLPNGEFFWGKYIYDVFKTIPNFKWTLQMGNIPPDANGNQVNARTTVVDPLAGTVTTTINNVYANSCTDIAMAKTLYHESVHAFLSIWWYQQQLTVNATYPQMYQEYLATNANMNYANHQEMYRTSVDYMSYNLKSFGTYQGYNLSQQYYIDMVLGGLMGTTYFNALDVETKNRITGLTIAETTNTTTQTPSGIKIKPQGTLVCPL